VLAAVGAPIAIAAVWLMNNFASNSTRKDLRDETAFTLRWDATGC
jgi:hypothetical protein